MSRLRGPKAMRPDSESTILLNQTLFGGHERGGKTIDPTSTDVPIDWAAVFGQSGPLALEIGFNRGIFLERLARSEPTVNLLGIEIQRRFCWRLANLLAESPDAPPNIKLLWADAKLVTNVLLAPSSVQSIYINFPDPWWKTRHHKRRLVDTSYAAELVNILEPGGEIWVKSDVKDIADEIQVALDEQIELKVSKPYEASHKPFTHREHKCVQQGMPIHRYRYTKSS
jgi:tRNA (guanine-N7-)-methyltransferase